MNVWKSTIDTLTGRRGAGLGTGRRRASRRFLSEYVPERFETRVVPAQLAPGPVLYDPSMLSVSEMSINFSTGEISCTYALTPAGIAAALPIQVGLASYVNAEDQVLGNPNGIRFQRLFDSDTAVLDATNWMVTLTVQLDLTGRPGSNHQQVDAFVGDVINRFTSANSDAYGGRNARSLYFSPGNYPWLLEANDGPGIGRGRG
jgi:hypothetical protein